MLRLGFEGTRESCFLEFKKVEILGRLCSGRGRCHTGAGRRKTKHSDHLSNASVGKKVFKLWFWVHHGPWYTGHLLNSAFAFFHQVYALLPLARKLHNTKICLELAFEQTVTYFDNRGLLASSESVLQPSIGWKNILQRSTSEINRVCVSFTHCVFQWPSPPPDMQRWREHATRHWAGWLTGRLGLEIYKVRPLRPFGPQDVCASYIPHRPNCNEQLVVHHNN